MKAFAIKAKTGFTSIAAAALIGAATLAPLSGAQAEPRKLKVDLTHTSVHFMIKHGGFSKVIGQFRKIEMVELTFDPPWTPERISPLIRSSLGL